MMIRTFLVAVSLAASSLAFAQQASQQPQAQPQMPRGPIKTPLGRHPAEVLGSKVVVSDMAKSFDFYTRVVGLKPAKSLAQTEPLPPPGTDPNKWPVEYGMNFSGVFGDAFFDLLRPGPNSKNVRPSSALFNRPTRRATSTRWAEPPHWL